MNKLEAEFRKIVVKMLLPIFAFPVENELTHDNAEGCPDICTIAGWLELKVAELPKRGTTRVAVDLRPAQRIWLRKWRRHGGRAWTLTFVDTAPGPISIRDPGWLWLLHDGAWSCDHLGESDLLTLRNNAVGQWSGGPQADELINLLTKRT